MQINYPNKIIKCILPCSLDSKGNIHVKSIVKNRNKKPLFSEDHDVEEWVKSKEHMYF